MSAIYFGEQRHLIAKANHDKLLTYVCGRTQMEWSKMKTKGTTPSPRSGHAGVLVGDKWYIAGGENRGVGELMTTLAKDKFAGFT